MSLKATEEEVTRATEARDSVKREMDGLQNGRSILVGEEARLKVAVREQQEELKQTRQRAQRAREEADALEVKLSQVMETSSRER